MTPRAADYVRDRLALSADKFKAGPCGTVAEMGAMATITLPAAPDAHSPTGGNTVLRLTDVNSRSFSLKLGDAVQSSWVPHRQRL